MKKKNPVFVGAVSVRGKDPLEMYFNTVDDEDETEDEIRNHYTNHPKGYELDWIRVVH
jgi:hypothetical protein